MRILTSLLMCLFTLNLWAQTGDQLGIRITQNGVNSVLNMARKYNGHGNMTKILTIPEKLYKFVLKKESLEKNPIVQILAQTTDVDFSKDLVFYLDSKKIDITGSLDSKNLTFNVSNQSETGFDLTIHAAIPTLNIKSKKLTLCDEATKKKDRCAGLMVSFVEPSISLAQGLPIKVAITLRVKFVGTKQTVSVYKIETNLDNKTKPEIKINFTELVVPQVTVSINGQEAVLDTSSLKEEVLKKRAFLANKLMVFAADFLSQDLVEMINRYLSDEELPRDIDIFNYNGVKQAKDLDVRYDFTTPAVADNTYVYIPRYDLQMPSKIIQTKTEESDFERIMREVKMMIYYARMTLKLGNLTTPDSKNLEMRASVELSLNRFKMKVGNTLGNSSRTIPALNMANQETANDHFQMYISEPVLNGMLDIINKTDLYNFILNSENKGKAGFSIKSVKVHFKTDKTSLKQKIYVIANAQVDLKQLQSNSLGDWLYNQIGVFLERNNNNAVIYFPLQFDIVPTISKEQDGTTKLKLKVGSPFDRITKSPFNEPKPSTNIDKNDPRSPYYVAPAVSTYVAPTPVYTGSYIEPMVNDFGYPSNVDKMSGTVRNALIGQLKDAFKDFTNKEFNVALDSLLNQKGVSFEVKNLKFINDAYFMLSGNIKDINFDVLSKRGEK